MVNEAVRIYFEYTDWFSKIKNINTFKTLFFILHEYDGYTCVITFTPVLRKELMDTCHMSYSSINKSIQDLLFYEALLPYRFEHMRTGEIITDKNKFFVNPYMFWKLTSEERDLYIEKLTKPGNKSKNNTI